MKAYPAGAMALRDEPICAVEMRDYELHGKTGWWRGLGELRWTPSMNGMPRPGWRAIRLNDGSVRLIH